MKFLKIVAFFCLLGLFSCKAKDKRQPGDLENIAADYEKQEKEFRNEDPQWEAKKTSYVDSMQKVINGYATDSSELMRDTIIND